MGVDVFFAISGFLITDHLMREARRSGRIDVPSFWARRVRRLLPASLLVLLVTSAAVLLVVPRALWGQFFTAVLGAVVYAENWVLAAQSVDYLAAENVATPVQHFWSLGVEEQFYLVWPVLIAGVMLFVGRSNDRIRTKRYVLGTLSVVFLGSLVASVVLTVTAPSLAYFATYVRAWEFAAGALVAIAAPNVLNWTSRNRAITAWIGWALIGSALLTYTGTTPFPSATALLPVAGALMVIVAGTQPEDWSPTPLVTFRPVQLVGNWSYSMYLWHWPMIVIVPYAVGHPLGLRTKIAILVVSTVAAALTKRWVEDAFRTRPGSAPAGATNERRKRRVRVRRVFVSGLAGMLVVAALPAAGLLYVASLRDDSAAAVQAARSDRCFGAGAMTSSECRGSTTTTLLPDPAAVFDDTDEAFKCYRMQGASELHRCTFGSDQPDALRVALTGDSHAAMLVPGFRDLVQKENWRLDVYVGWGGYWRDPQSAEGADRAYLTKLDTALLNGKYDVILTTAHRQIPAAKNASQVQAAMERVWNRARTSGTKVIAIRDNPQITAATLSCVTGQDSDVTDPTKCEVPVRTGLGGADNVAEAAKSDDVPVIDTAQYFCSATECPAVIGGVIVYRDEHHITATYSKTLAPILIKEIERTFRATRAG